MSVQARLQAHLKTAQAAFVTQLDSAKAKGVEELAQLEALTGRIGDQLTAKQLSDAFESAKAKQLGTKGLGALLGNLVSGMMDFEALVGPVNDAGKFAAVVNEARQELASVRAQTTGLEVAEAIARHLPRNAKAGKSAEDLRAIGAELQTYALALIDTFGKQLEELAAGAMTTRERALSLGQMKAMGEVFKPIVRGGLLNTLEGFDFREARAIANPKVAAFANAVSQADLPKLIVVKTVLGNVEASKTDPAALNQAAWTTFEGSKHVHELSEALRIAAYAVRLSDGTDAMSLDTAACLAAKLGDLELAETLSAAADAIDSTLANDSKSYLSAIARGEEHPVERTAQVAARYPALVVACESAGPYASSEPVYLKGAFGLSYEANLADPGDLNLIAWSTYEDASSTPAQVQSARDAAATACKLSEYSYAPALDTLACLEHRLGNEEVGRQAYERAKALSPKDVADGAEKIYGTA